MRDIERDEKKVGKPVRSILVGDEAAIVLPLKKLLERQGWQVAAAASVAAALEQIEKTPFDAALVDLGLPDGSGETVCHALRGQGDAAILILTARADEASVIRALEQGADDYIIKPFRAGELLSRIKAVLPRRQGPEPLRLCALPVERRRSRASVGEHQITLTAQYDHLLLLLLTTPGQLLQRGPRLHSRVGQSG